MSRYVVCVRAADGRSATYSIRATSERKACREALRDLPKQDGWRVQYALEGGRPW